MLKKYVIKNLDCASCAQKIENMIQKRDDVQECSLSFANELLMIESVHEIDIDELQSAIQKLEPEVTIEEKGQHQSHVHHHTHHEDACGCGHDHSHHEHHHGEDCDHDHDHCDCDHQHDHDHRSLDKQGVLAYHIAGLDCASCAMKVESAIQKMEQVDDAVLNFSTETLQVVPHSQVNKDELLIALQQVIDHVEDGVVLSYKDEKRIIEKPQLFVWKDNLALIIGVVAYIISLLLKSQSYAVFGFVIAYILIGYEVVFKAVKNILRGEIFDENFLMSIATIGAFLIGDYAEAVAVLLFYSIGEIFQSYAVNKTRSSISSLMDIKSEYANLKTNDGVIKVTPEEVKVGDILVVKVGEKIPLDGVIVNGHSLLDTSSLTGESVPRDAYQNDEVLAGVVNLTEILEVKVTKPYVDSTVSKILELMENAASKKAPIEKFITRFARIYTPTVVGLAVLLAIVPMFIFEDAQFTEWLYRALTFLVVSCPCALVISIPLGLYAGLGKASKLGALIKGGNYLELLKDVDTVVFDKTGTLTKGSFDVVEVNGSDDLLMYGAYGEFYSNHPIAKSIVAKYAQNIDESQIRDFKEVAGKGIDVMIRQKHVVLGNASFFEELGIAVKEPQTVGTIVYVAIDGQFAGSIVVADQIKETTVKGIQALKSVGIKNTVMLTGDHHRVAEDVAQKLGIDSVYSELLPQDKVGKVEELLNRKQGYVAFVGDGINDAPVLARADVGIAMGGVGSDAAIEAADVVLMQDNIETIKDAIVVSHKTNKILRQNVAFTLIIKIGVLLLTMFGLSNMWMGVFADVGVTLIAILNAMRVLR
ncbi:heavy metal translocating P-type ATPase [Candidatus Stoquefichus sp. SB1]|uniref:heavy metal translocating P-type ATPase n=1 Tax=Candidatus Stoquefichus sp. SB1 TaxID=1658109 RepID=UPI00067F1E56|nr:heavy metal translocating P-type ATPase [Candidatus Stoquefichus sp. SB1]